MRNFCLVLSLWHALLVGKAAEKMAGLAFRLNRLELASMCEHLHRICCQIFWQLEDLRKRDSLKE